MNLTPGFYLDTDIETLLTAELNSRGVDVTNADTLRKNLVMHVVEGTADFYWTYEGAKILSFKREVTTETLIAYSVAVERKIISPIGHNSGIAQA